MAKKHAKRKKKAPAPVVAAAAKSEALLHSPATPKSKRLVKAVKLTGVKVAKPAKAAKAAKAPKPGAPRVFPVMLRPPLPPELLGELPSSMPYEELANGGAFRFRGAVERKFNEVWRKIDDHSYGDGLPESPHVFPYPEGSPVIPVS